MLRSDLDGVPTLTARATGVSFAMATQPGDDPAAAADGWQRCLAWLGANGVA